MSVDDFIDGLPDSYDSWNDTYRVDFFRDNLNGFNSLPNETQVLKIILAATGLGIFNDLLLYIFCFECFQFGIASGFSSSDLQGTYALLDAYVFGPNNAQNDTWTFLDFLSKSANQNLCYTHSDVMKKEMFLLYYVTVLSKYKRSYRPRMLH